MADILDRRNELAGNLSLYQEVNFIPKINHLVDKLGDPEDGKLHVPGKEDREYKHIGVRWIRMSRPLDFASKLDRNPTFIRTLMHYGERRSAEFLREPAG
jgi:NTE family protein